MRKAEENQFENQVQNMVETPQVFETSFDFNDKYNLINNINDLNCSVVSKSLDDPKIHLTPTNQNHINN